MTKRIVEIISAATEAGPGEGVFGTILRYGAIEKEMPGYLADADLRTAEVMGILAGLEALKRPCKVRVSTPSHDLLETIEKLNNGERFELEEGRDHWEKLADLLITHEVEFFFMDETHPDCLRTRTLSNRAIQTGRQVVSGLLALAEKASASKVFTTKTQYSRSDQFGLFAKAQ